MDSNKSGIDSTANIRNDKEILQGILSQINSFDSKAGILISVIGIVFGLSLTLLGNFTHQTSRDPLIIAFAITYILFILSSLIAIVFSVLVIVPRESKKDKVNVNYYMDLCDMNYDDFKRNSSNFFSNDAIFFNQIKTNAIICKRKHRFLKLSIISMLPCGLFAFALVLMAIFL